MRRPQSRLDRRLSVPDPATSRDERLPFDAILAYSLPAIGVGFISWLISLYLFKFSTDTLLIAPAAMGVIFAAARIWDAISDPLAGYLSDGTRSRLGRRRPWMLASALPIAVVPVMVWSPPGFVQGAALIVWMAVGILALETVATGFLVPHAALGAELSMSHHERTRIFAYRHLTWNLGFLLCTGAVYLLTTSDDKRSTAFFMAAIGGAIAAVFILYGVTRLRERSDHQGRGSPRPFHAFADVWRNPHARLLLLVFLIESLGTATLGVLAPYFAQYVVGAESLYTMVLLSHFIPTMLVVPVAPPLSRRFGKKKLWAIAMTIQGSSFGALFLTGPGDVVWLCACSAGAGLGTGIGAIVGPSIQADVIDYDEYTTGERKEGAYFAIWNFVRKAAGGITGVLTGFALQFAGFEPNVEQSETVKLVIRLLFSVFPCIAFAVGISLFLRFRLTGEEHERIRAEIDARGAAER
jgi:GPH family glycoside/pentoside/hexuronide:cation symporter